MLAKNNLNISNKVKIIFDLDYTLLDTAKLKEKIAGIFDKENFQADYDKYYKKAGINFNCDDYLSILKDEGRIDCAREKKLKSKIKKIISHIDNYLKTGAKNVLKYFKSTGAELILMTFGNKKWQQEKIKNLSIAKYFAKIIYEEKDKKQSRYLKSLSKTDEKILIINDNISEAEEMLKILKKGELFLIKGPYDKGYKSHELSDLVVKNKKI